MSRAFTAAAATLDSKERIMTSNAESIALRFIGLALAAMVAGCGSDSATGTMESPALAKGGKPGGGTTTTIPQEMKLSNLRDLKCSGIMPTAISRVAGDRVVGYGWCGSGTQLFTWTEAAGPALVGGGSTEGMANDVAGDGTLVGHVRVSGNLRPFVIPGGSGPPVLLPMLPGDGPNGDATAVSDDGRYLAGTTSSGGVLWTRQSDGTYSGPELIGSVGPSAVSLDGQVVIGTSGDRAVRWVKQGSWSVTYLKQDVAGEPVYGSSAEAVNARGDVIAGSRALPLDADPGTQYSEPVVWRLVGTEWVLEPLRGFTFSEGGSQDVVDYHGSVVVVGEAWEDDPGKGGVLWPVVWTWDRTPAKAFCLPQRLAIISKQGWGGGSAAGVSESGRIVGRAWTSSVSNSGYPVTWRLPATAPCPGGS